MCYTVDRPPRPSYRRRSQQADGKVREMWMNGNPPNYPGQQNYTGAYPTAGQTGYPPAGQPVYQQMNVNNQPPYQAAQNGYQQPMYTQQSQQYPLAGQQAQQYPPMGQQSQQYPPMSQQSQQYPPVGQQSQQYPPMGQGYPQQPYQTAQNGYPQQPYPPVFQQQQQQPVNPQFRQQTGVNRPMYGNGFQSGYGCPPANQSQEMQQPPARNTFDPIAAIKVVLYAGIPALFVLSMLFGSIPALKWVFVAIAAIGIGAMWVRNIVPENTRFMLSAVYGAFAVVALVSALTGTAPGDSRTAQNNAGGASQSVSQGASGQQASSYSATPTPSPTPTENINASEMVRQLESFFYFWSNNQIDQMIELCPPSWRASVDSPSNELFVKLSNRKMIEYGNIRVMNGSDSDTTRTVLIDATVSKYAGTDATKYRFKIVMKQENGQWYVDPNSLDSQEAAEETPSPTPTVTPTPTVYVQVNNSTKLYYNPDGGSKYHADDRCPSAAEKYLPFKGVFTYGELNNSPYSGLDPCNRCNAPLRQ